ncbi:hypothetical protein TNCV_1032201 [Trichonephila clavipes]|nr:hypothetical protein TNCV_1032201 [Trichonephila clavipes]
MVCCTAIGVRINYSTSFAAQWNAHNALIVAVILAEQPQRFVSAKVQMNYEHGEPNGTSVWPHSNRTTHYHNVCNVQDILFAHQIYIAAMDCLFTPSIIYLQ